MSTGTEIHMMQLGDSLFPTGLFAASGGVEELFMRGRITGADGLAEYLGSVISWQLGPLDCAFVAAACRSKDRDEIAGLDATCGAMRINEEARDMSRRSGRQLAACAAGFAGGDLLAWYAGAAGTGTDGEYPVSFGVCCGALGLGEEAAAAAFLYGAVSAGVGAALRLGMIDHLEGQQVIHSLKPAISGEAASCAGRGAGDAWQFAPEADIYQAMHEARDGGMFAT